MVNIASRYKRWRHGRGFGVHSPLAYDLVMNTLRENYRYYAYETLDYRTGATMDSAISKRQIRLIFRLLVRFNPNRVAVVADKDFKLIELAIKGANSKAIITSPDDENCKFFIMAGEQSEELCCKKEAVYLFITGKGDCSSNAERLWLEVTQGIWLDNNRGFAIIIASPKLSKQKFDIRF